MNVVKLGDLGFGFWKDKEKWKIWKQWKVPRKREWGLLKLGVTDLIAHKTAYRGNRYMNVATKSVLTRAISKEKLTKRGLVT